MSVYKTERKRDIGRQLSELLNDRSKWPSSLTAFYEDAEIEMTPTGRSRGLTVELLLRWMAKNSEMESEVLATEAHVKYFSDRLGEWKRWSYNPSRGGVDPLVLNLIGESDLIKDGSNSPITDPFGLVAFLMGN